MNLSTGNIIRASETSAESGKSHSTGAVIKVNDATVDVTQGILIKPEHFAKQQIFIIKDGKMQKKKKKTCVFNIIGRGGLTYIGGYYTNPINISKIKSVEITYMTTNLSDFSVPQYRFTLVKLSNLDRDIHGYYNESNEPSEGRFYYVGYDDYSGFYRHPTFGSQLLGRYPKDKGSPNFTEANGDFHSSFETISFNLNSSINDEYNCIIAGNCFTNNFKLYIKDFILKY